MNCGCASSPRALSEAGRSRPGGSQPSTAAAPGLALGLSAVVNSKGSGSGSPSWSARFLPPPGEPAAGPSLLPVSRPQEINALDLIKAKKKKKVQWVVAGLPSLNVWSCLVDNIPSTKDRAEYRV